MLFDDSYQTVTGPAEGFFKDKGSKFLAYSFPIEGETDAKAHLATLRELHPKAVHHCYAYRLGADRMSYRMSDDGEPSGTAGKPILGQIDSRQLTNTAVIVVRYFGGTLLGVPGLINAYKTSTALVLQTVPVLQKQVEIIYSLQFDYTRLNDIMQIIKQYNCTILSQEMQLFSTIRVGIPKNRVEEALFKLKELHNVEVKHIL